MRNIEPECVDAIVTDPPYGIDYQSAWRTDIDKRHKKIKNDKSPFIWFLYDSYRILKWGGGVYSVFVDGMFSKHLKKLWSALGLM